MTRFNPRTPYRVRFRQPVRAMLFQRFNPRTPYRVRCPCAGGEPTHSVFQSAHSIQSAMATHSKISPIRALASPLSQQNRRILGNPSQLTHPCARPRREKTSRFYDHLGFALEPSFGTSHSFVLRLQNFGRPRPTTFLWSNHVTQPSDAFDLTRQTIASPTFPLAHQQDIVYKECSTY